MSEPFLTTLGPWYRMDAVPDGHTAVIPAGKGAGILYRHQPDRRDDFAVAFLWAEGEGGTTMPGWALDIQMVSYADSPGPDKYPSNEKEK